MKCLWQLWNCHSRFYFISLRNRFYWDKYTFSEVNALKLEDYLGNFLNTRYSFTVQSTVSVSISLVVRDMYNMTIETYQGCHHRAFKKLENYNSLHYYPVFKYLSQWMDGHSKLLENAWETKWFNNKLYENRICQTVGVLISIVYLQLLG